MRRLRLFGAIVAVAVLLPGLLTAGVTGHGASQYVPLAQSSFRQWDIDVQPPLAVPVVADLPLPVRGGWRPAAAATPPVAVLAVKPKPKPRPRPVAAPRPRPAPSPAPVARAPRMLGRSISGQATYYCWPNGNPPSKCMYIHPTGGMYAAAGPALRAAICGSSTSNCWRGRTVLVRGPSGSAYVVLADWCACGGGHLIDLYHDVLVKVTTNPWGAWVKVSW